MAARPSGSHCKHGPGSREQLSSRGLSTVDASVAFDLGSAVDCDS
jgi:hypothetical protein